MVILRDVLTFFYGFTELSSGGIRTIELVPLTLTGPITSWVLTQSLNHLVA